jgi:hypothetical protein
MILKRALYASALVLPLALSGAAAALAHDDVSLEFGLGSPYYYGGDPYYYDYGLDDPFIDDPDIVDVDVVDDDDIDIDDMDVEVEPAAAPAEPVGCVKTNVTNLKNACPN